MLTRVYEDINGAEEPTSNLSHFYRRSSWYMRMQKHVSKPKPNFVPGSAFVAFSPNKVISCLSADTTNYPSVRTQYSPS
jgi:hypothetical protein